MKHRSWKSSDEATDVSRSVDSPDLRPVTYETVARRAYERYEARGREDGHDLEDWLEAERDVRVITQEG